MHRSPKRIEPPPYNLAMASSSRCLEVFILLAAMQAVSSDSNVGSLDGVFGRPGTMNIVQHEGNLRGDSGGEVVKDDTMMSPAVPDASDTTSALAAAEETPEQEGRRLACGGVSDVCWINAECCTGRCVSTHKCGPRVR
mmetsp:Transcript_55404/g.159306  ORF Transcript_55404/g.159306 Transcript_55404/m.159306 type:complete len:139 (-) Transcript_55404:141-557(-)